ncbi:MAG: hypothetical protein AAF608_02970 [Pseudomonadota bacterium]
MNGQRFVLFPTPGRAITATKMAADAFPANQARSGIAHRFVVFHGPV